MTPNDKLKLLVDEINKLKQELTQKAKDGLMLCLGELFEMHPEVRKIHFTAYTPYWNDGGECTYWCNAYCADINEGGEYPEVSRNVVNVFRDALKQLNSNTWKDIVGDHASVTITPQGIDVEEYEHE